MNLEDFIANSNEMFFFKEFTFSVLEVDTDKGEIEIADNMVYLDGLTFVYQLKERQPQKTTEEEEEKWFNTKILKEAKNQIKKTIQYIKNHPNIELENHRGHHISFSEKNINPLLKIIVYKPHGQLPNHCLQTKFYESKEAGIIHIFDERTYRGILHSLITPAEISNYLIFKEKLILEWKNKIEFTSIYESAILGQYYSENYDAMPSNEFAQYYRDLENNIEQWDVRKLLSVFWERIIPEDQEKNYYLILKEIAKLNRFELKAFRERYILAREDSKNDRGRTPYVMISERTGCGFVFMPILKKDKEKWLEFQYYPDVFRYQNKLNKCIGIFICADTEEWFDCNWMFLNEEWKENLEFDGWIEKNEKNYGSFFRETKRHKITYLDKN